MRFSQKLVIQYYAYSMIVFCMLGVSIYCHEAMYVAYATLGAATSTERGGSNDSFALLDHI